MEGECFTGMDSAVNAINTVEGGKAIITLLEGGIQQWDYIQQKKLMDYKLEEKLSPITTMTLDKDQRWIVLYQCHLHLFSIAGSTRELYHSVEQRPWHTSRSNTDPCTC